MPSHFLDIAQSVAAQSRLLRHLSIAAACGLFLAATPAPAQTITAVSGSAFGYSLSVSLLGGPANQRGPAPTVTLPPSGSAGPNTASVPTASATVAPVTFFSSNTITVSTQGTPGPGGSVTTSTSISTVNTSGTEVLTASQISSSCTASASATTGSTTVTGGTLQTDSGLDINNDGDYIDAGEHPPVFVTIPANPAPNTKIAGHLHVNGTTETFEYIFNEQTLNPDGSITVNAAHQRFLGPSIIGNLFIGQAKCGVTPPAVRPTLDIDASVTSTKYDALTDGLLVIRYLFNLTGPALTSGALGSTASRTTPEQIRSYLDSIRGSLDIDGNGNADALTDGLLVIRYLFNLRGDALITNAVAPSAPRSTAPAIETYIQSLMP